MHWEKKFGTKAHLGFFIHQEEHVIVREGWYYPRIGGQDSLFGALPILRSYSLLQRRNKTLKQPKKDIRDLSRSSLKKRLYQANPTQAIIQTS